MQQQGRGMFRGGGGRYKGRGGSGQGGGQGGGGAPQGGQGGGQRGRGGGGGDRSRGRGFRGGRGGRAGGGGGAGAGGGAPSSGDPCKNFLTGDCRFGDRCGYEHNMKMLRLAPGAPLGEAPRGPTPPIRSLAFVESQNFMLVPNGNTVRVIDDTLKERMVLPIEGEVDCVSTAGRWVFVGFQAAVPGRTVVPVGCLKAFDQAASKHYFLTAQGLPFAHKMEIACMDTFTPSGEAEPILFTGSLDGTIRMWRWTPAGAFTCNTLDEHARGVMDVLFVGQRLYSASADCTIKVWNLAAGRCTNTIPSTTLPAMPAMPAAAAAGGFGRYARPTTAAATGGAGGAGGGINRAEVVALDTLSLDGQNYLVVGLQDGTVQTYNLADPDKPALMTGDAYMIPPDGHSTLTALSCMDLASSPGTPLLITGYADGTLILRDVRSGICFPVANLHGQRNGGHVKEVRALYPLPGDCFMSAGLDGYALLWQLLVPHGEDGPPAAAAAVAPAAAHGGAGGAPGAMVQYGGPPGPGNVGF